MGITIHYHGKMADLERVEELEDRVLDLALELGGTARVWRSWPDDRPERIVRGLILNLAPGQESFSLLISPEGWLVPLHEIELAELGELSEPPYCWVKTQFGPVEGHVAIIHLLDYLRQEFFPDLQVTDEGEYWEKRDLNLLIQKTSHLGQLISGLADQLQNYPLSTEASEDPEIVVRRIERVAKLVDRTLRRVPEHPPVDFDEEGSEFEPLNEQQWDDFYKEQRRKQERLSRAIEEEVNQGTDHDDAFISAMRNEGLIDLPGSSEGVWEIEEGDVGLDTDDESWSDDPEQSDWTAEDETDWIESNPLREEKKHPLLEEAIQFRVHLYRLLDQVLNDDQRRRGDVVDVLMEGIGEMQGGLVQALYDMSDQMSRTQRGLSIAQLKRALRGIAFASGALYPMKDSNLISEQDFDQLYEKLKWFREQTLERLVEYRDFRSL